MQALVDDIRGFLAAEKSAQRAIGAFLGDREESFEMPICIDNTPRVVEVDDALLAIRASLRLGRPNKHGQLTAPPAINVAGC